MATEIKNAFKEIVDRLQAAEASLLSDVTLVEGPTEQTFAQEDMPVVIYEILDGGFAEDTHFPDRARSKFTVMFTVMADSAKGYYSDDGFGILDLFEKIMSVLDKNLTTGLTDLTGAGYWGPIPPQYKVGAFERSGLINTYLIEAEFQTVRYGRGSLRT